MVIKERDEVAEPFFVFLSVHFVSKGRRAVSVLLASQILSSFESNFYNKHNEISGNLKLLSP